MYSVPTEDVFDSKYTHDETIVSEHYDDGRLETFGADLEKVMEIKQNSPRRLWTMVDDDEGDGTYLVAGFHYVNRICYLVTTEEWESDDEEYLLD